VFVALFAAGGGAAAWAFVGVVAAVAVAVAGWLTRYVWRSV